MKALRVSLVTKIAGAIVIAFVIMISISAILNYKNTTDDSTKVYTRRDSKGVLYDYQHHNEY